MEKGDGLYETCGGVGGCEDGVEDGGEIESVERGGVGGGDDGARAGEAGGYVFSYGAGGDLVVWFLVCVDMCKIRTLS